MNKQLLNEHSSINRFTNLRQLPVTKILLIIMTAIIYGIPVYAQPAAPSPVTATPAAVCPSSPFTALKAVSAGNTIKWYVTPTGGTTIGTSASNANFNVTVSASTTYYAESVNSGGTPSVTRTSISVTLQTAPQITSIPSDIMEDNTTGDCGTVVSYAPATATGDPTPVITYSQNSGSNFDVGTNTVIVAASNVCASTSLSFDITVADIENPSIIAPANVPVTAPAGAGSVTGVSLGTPTDGDNCGISSVTNDAPSVYYGGNTTVTWTATDIHGNTATGTQTVTVTLNNSAPVITGFTTSTTAGIMAAGSSTTMTVTFTDESAGGPWTIVFDWNDGTGTTTLSNVTANTGSASHTYANSGVYEPIVTITDGAGASSSTTYQYLGVYVTGNDHTTAGGYFYPPAGSLVSNPSATGKTNIGDNCKPHNTPGVFNGQFEMNFKDGNFNFKSGSPTNWQYLAISDCYLAIFKGSGTVNGSGNYGVLVAQTDKDRNPSNANNIRVKIWNKNAGNAVVFDTQPGDADNDLPTTSMANGSIKIHTQNTCVSKSETQPSADGQLHASVYPNPFASDFTVSYSSNSAEKIQVEIYDVAGKLVQSISDVEANTAVKVQNNLSPGLYFIHAIQGNEINVVKVAKNNN